MLEINSVLAAEDGDERERQQQEMRDLIRLRLKFSARKLDQKLALSHAPADGPQIEANRFSESLSPRFFRFQFPIFTFCFLSGISACAFAGH